MPDHRSNIYEDPSTGNLIFRASSLSRCDTGLIHSAIGSPTTPTPAFMQRAFDEGTNGEAEVLRKFCDGVDWNAGSKMRHSGTWLDPASSKWKMLDPKDEKSYHDHNGRSFQWCNHGILDDDQFTIEIPMGGQRVVRGHMDGVAEQYQASVESPGRLLSRAIVEAKLFGPDYWDKWCRQGIDGFLDYAMQISLYGEATGLDVIFVVGRKHRLYETPGDKDSKYLGFEVGEVHVTYIKNEDLPVSMGKVKARVFKLGGLIDKVLSGEVPAPVCTPPHPDYPCEFYQFAHEDGKVQGGFGEDVVPVEIVAGKGVAVGDKSAVTVITGEDQIALDRHATVYNEALKQETELKVDKANAKDAIDKILARYRDSSKVMIGKDGEEVADKSGVFQVGDWEIAWDHKWSPPSSNPKPPSGRMSDTPKVKYVGTDKGDSEE